MTIKVINVRTADSAISKLDQLCKNGHNYFRGHRDFRWRLQSTLARHHITPPSRLTTHDLDTMIDHFIVNLTSIGVSLPFERTDRRGRLEFARHYGVPSPLIDFSRSPYVALFFAFNGVRPHHAKPKDKAAIYCINAFEIAGAWARLTSDRFSHNAGVQFADIHNEFLYKEDGIFDDGYRSGIIKLMSMPASWNTRMRRQHGVFIYDMLNYKQYGFNDLEDFLGQPEIKGENTTPTLTKIIIPHSIGQEIFERLEITNNTATFLYNSPEGAALDVINAYNYAPRAGRTWDVGLPPGREMR